MFDYTDGASFGHVIHMANVKDVLLQEEAWAHTFSFFLCGFNQTFTVFFNIF